MAIYDYKCLDCGEITEHMHPMSGPEFSLICKRCGSQNLEKCLSCAYVQFKGAGWDTNDNRRIQSE